jgi:hypothetical protein
MDLFKARQRAEAEYREVLAASGVDPSTAEKRLEKSRGGKALYYPKHNGITAGTAATLLLEM